jgi:hypothetical protein
MPRQVTKASPERRLQRVLAALESELLQASDEEVRQAAGDSGIDPDMQGSIAWLGIFFAGTRRFDEVFDMEELRKRWRQRLEPPDEKDK